MESSPSRPSGTDCILENCQTTRRCAFVARVKEILEELPPIEQQTPVFNTDTSMPSEARQIGTVEGIRASIQTEELRNFLEQNNIGCPYKKEDLIPKELRGF